MQMSELPPSSFPWSYMSARNIPLNSPELALSLEGRIRKGKKRMKEGKKKMRRDWKIKIMPRWRRCRSTSPPPSHKCKLKNLTLVHSHEQIPCLIVCSLEKNQDGSKKLFMYVVVYLTMMILVCVWFHGHWGMGWGGPLFWRCLVGEH